MALTRLKNVFTSKTGRCLYVNSDDFDASDSFDNRGNSPNRPFKSIQRALIEAARFSYQSGQFNDTFESFSIVLYPGDYVIDNRPGRNTAGAAFIPSDIAELSASSDMTLVDDSGNINPNNVLYKFNSIEGGVIVPRGTSIVGMDLRKTKLRPLYVPDPTSGSIASSAIFRVTGGCYFWQFSFFDGISSGVYKDPAQPSASSPPTFSHHKLTCFEYADGKNIQSSVSGTDTNALSVTDLDLYYQKVAKAWSDIPDSTSILSADELQARVEENRIVGPNTAGPKTISSIKTDFASTNVFTTTAEVETSDEHGFSVGTPVLLEGVTGTDASRFNGSFFITAIPTTTTFRYTIKNPSTGAPSGNPTATGSTVKVEVDNVDSSSPYIFNCSLRSTWGMQGMHADGSKATGFKSMVVAQFTGVSLQKDDNAFIKWDGSAYIAGSHTDGDSIFKASYRNFHVKCSNDSVIQAVSVFAVGFADHFVAESGGDQSITNSNSNFGSCALRAKGFKGASFTQDKAGTITHIIPPKKLPRTYAVVSGTTFTTTFNSQTVTATNNTHGIVATDYIRFGNADNIESYLVTAVNGTNGNLTLNRGYRNISGAPSGSGISVYKGTVSEIPVGYIALDVQKIQDNASQGNAAWAINQSGIQVGDSRTNVGNAYLATAVAGSGTTSAVVNQGPTHTSGTAVDNEVTWAYIGAVNTRLYLYGYTSVATKPPYVLQGYNIGARKQDKLYVSLIDGSTQSTFAASLTPDGTTSPADSKFTDITVQGFTPGDVGHPLQYDTYHQSWYLRVTAATSGSSSASATTGYKGIHYHLGNETFYADSLFTGSSYLQRIADNRSARDRTYRVRYTVNNQAALSREPINGYVIQPRNVPTGQSYGSVYYIYDIVTATELKKNTQDGVYYMTVLKGSISPTNGNLSAFSFAQNINNLYPTLDKDNPTEDPNEATSVASNTVVGLVETTNGSGTEDTSLSITKESIGDWIIETRNNYTNASTTDAATEGYITLEARDGDATEVDLPSRMVEVNSSGTATELRRPSILRSGNHTFEYVGFGPGNYSTGLPSVQNRVLTDAETLLAQSQKEDGGIAFYSGLNSNGDLFIGNTRISAVTGEEASLDTPTLSIVGETANLRPVFDEIIIRDKLTVDNTSSNAVVIKGGTDIQSTLKVTDGVECADLTITGNAQPNNEATIKMNVYTQTPGSGVSANAGDIAWKGNYVDGQYQGWYYTGAAWAKFGLTDTGNLSITQGTGGNSGGNWTDANGDLTFANALGINISGTGALNVNSGNTTLGGNLTVTGTSEFNNTTSVDADFRVRTSGGTNKFTVASATGNTVIQGNLTINGSLNATTLSGNATSADVLSTPRTIGGVSFDGSANINLPGVNQSGNQNTSGNAGSATQLYVTDDANNTDYRVLFTDQGGSGANRDVHSDATSFFYNPFSNTLGVQKITCQTIGTAGITTFTGDLSGNALTASEVKVEGDSNSSNTYYIYFGEDGGAGTNKRVRMDNNLLSYQPSTNKLSTGEIACSTIGAAGNTTFGTASQNAYGARTVSTSGPSGGNNGDIHYKY